MCKCKGYKFKKKKNLTPHLTPYAELGALQKNVEKRREEEKREEKEEEEKKKGRAKRYGTLYRFVWINVLSCMEQPL